MCSKYVIVQIIAKDLKWFGEDAFQYILTNLNVVVPAIDKCVDKFYYQSEKDFKTYINKLFIEGVLGDEPDADNYVGINSFDFINWATAYYTYLETQNDFFSVD